METMTDQAQQAEVAVRKAPLWEDVVDIFVSPAQLFRRNAGESWVKPWLVVSAVSIVFYYLFLPAAKAISQAAMQAEMARRGVTEIPAAAQSFAHVMQLAGGILLPVFSLVLILLLGAVIWILGAMLKGGPSFQQSALIVAWASFVTLVQQLLLDVVILVKINGDEPLSVVKDTSFGVLRFLDPASLSGAAVPFLQRLDIFPIWTALLWLVGLKVICRWPAEKATLAAVLAWLIYAIPGTLWALVTGG